MARDRPSPYGEGVAFIVARLPVPRDGSSTVFFIVARGPVPRERWMPRTMARDRPSPYGEGVRFFSVFRPL